MLRARSSAGGGKIPERRAIASSETVLFMHIPKTAGTAFREAISGNYKASQIAYLYPDPPGFLACEFGSLPLEQRARFRLVLGHYHYGVHRFLPQKSTYISIVRDPVRRVISHFRYLIEPEKGPGGAAPSLLAELLERGATVNLDNLMVRCFSGVVKADVPPGQVNRDVYELAVHNLRTSFKFVGYQERSQEAYAALQAQFGWNQRAALEMVNRGGSDDSGFESVRKTIEHFNRWDCQLYAEIRRLYG
jgi:Sulfotransferase family